MTSRSADLLPPDPARVTELFDARVEDLYRHRDRSFLALLLVQWALALALSLVISPTTWSGTQSQLHPHVWLAIFGGGLITLPAVWLATFEPGWVGTRHAIAAVQMLWSGLLIHLTGGRIETHFHVFGSLAFLAFYRDWRVLLTGTAVMATDHLLRGLLWPASIYGVTNPEWWRFLEHASWVAFEDIVLVLGILDARREMLELSVQQARLEAVNHSIELQVAERTAELVESREEIRSLVESTQAIPFRFSFAERRLTYIGPQIEALTGFTVAECLQPDFAARMIHPDDLPGVEQSMLSSARGELTESETEVRHRTKAGGWLWLRAIVRASGGGSDRVANGVLLDVTERRRMESELYQAQKLESVGRLASGIAHEINTPIQFVNDSVIFVQRSFEELERLLTFCRGALRRVAAGDPPADLEAQLEAAEAEADLPYLTDRVPKALVRSVDGLGRVAELVRSLKEFAHPDQRDKAPADLNHALTSTLVIAHNELKYVAQVTTDLAELPPVTCRVNELNQVFLNLLVNAGHAIGDAVKDSGALGQIRVSTRQEGNEVVVAIADSGLGIPLEIRDRIFEPFFTTKEVGRGTGQGLAIARNVIVEKHGGQISFETELGQGTTFIIRLPIEAPALGLGVAA